MNFNNLDQLYRSVIMDHYKNPRNKGVLDNGSMTVKRAEYVNKKLKEHGVILERVKEE
nr:iron-sulfur cluster assembly scaffold protein [Staphylococcus aureus]